MILRDGRGHVTDVGPGIGLASRRVGEGRSSLIDGPGPMAGVPKPPKVESIVDGAMRLARRRLVSTGLGPIDDVDEIYLLQEFGETGDPDVLRTFGILPLRR